MKKIKNANHCPVDEVIYSALRVTAILLLLACYTVYGAATLELPDELPHGYDGVMLENHRPETETAATIVRLGEPIEPNFVASIGTHAGEPEVDETNVMYATKTLDDLVKSSLSKFEQTPNLTISDVAHSTNNANFICYQLTKMDQVTEHGEVFRQSGLLFVGMKGGVWIKGVICYEGDASTGVSMAWTIINMVNIIDNQ